ncbi:MAG: hypothetical protein EHM72_06800 [Calditrichaeota bacterium]|nr:MAG: hypothetical protein EHM72_06800 [Calditrichota bacterium]
MIKISLFIGWAIAASLFAQEVEITSMLLTPDIKIFMLNDLNFTGRSSGAAECFQVMISNNTALPQSCTLRLNIRAEFQGDLAFGETNPFTMSPNEVTRVTNLNLFSQGQRFSLEEYYIENRGQELIQELLASNRLPADIYYFLFEVQREGSSLSNTLIRIDITNPSSIELLAPGNNAASSRLESVYTHYPLFRWESDMSTFRLVIAEYLQDSGDVMSPEEILRQKVVFDRRFYIQRRVDIGIIGDAEILPTTLYQYPVSGVHPLEEGQVYYWQVIGLVESSGSPREFPSEIWRFQLNPGTGQTTLTPLQQQLLEWVQYLDGRLLQPDGELNALIPNENVRLNGVTLDEEEILNIIAKLYNGTYRPIEWAVE